MFYYGAVEDGKGLGECYYIRFMKRVDLEDSGRLCARGNKFLLDQVAIGEVFYGSCWWVVVVIGGCRE